MISMKEIHSLDLINQVRLNKNPKWYKLSPEMGREQIEQKLQELVTRSLKALAELHLITLEEVPVVH